MRVHKLSLFLIAAGAAVGLPAMSMAAPQRLAATPPMGWNGWAHYQCGFTAADILANARALVRTGLAAHGYDTVTIDDCWMLKDRDSKGNLQADPRRFPHGMRPVADAIHAMGLRFGIYEDAGPATCGGFAGSGGSVAGGKPHFLADARLFAGWGVDYLKLDGCNVQPARGPAGNAAYRAVDALDAEIDAHDTALWKIRPAGGCRAAERVGVVTRIVPEVPQMPEGVQRYTRCLAAPGRVQECAGTAAQRWRFTRHGSLRSGRNVSLSQESGRCWRSAVRRTVSAGATHCSGI